MYERPQLGLAPAIVSAAIPVVGGVIKSIFGGGGPSAETLARHQQLEAALTQAYAQGNVIAWYVLRDLAGAASPTEHQATLDHWDQVSSLVYWDYAEQQSHPGYNDASERTRLRGLLPSIQASVQAQGSSVQASILPRGSGLMWLGLGLAGVYLLSRKRAA